MEGYNCRFSRVAWAAVEELFVAALVQPLQELVNDRGTGPADGQVVDDHPYDVDEDRDGPNVPCRRARPATRPIRLLRLRVEMTMPGPDPAERRS